MYVDSSLLPSFTFVIVISSRRPKGMYQSRWYSSWILISAYIPIVLLYVVWLPMTCMGKIKSTEDDIKEKQPKEEEKENRVRVEFARKSDP